MPKFNKIHRVNHSASNMFDLVADVECYPEFVPMCDRLKIRSRRDIGQRQRIVTDMTIAYKFIRESFTTQVTLNRPDLKVDVQYIDGPFRYLDNQWQFIELGEDQYENQCEIHFEINYEFKSKALGLLMGGMFELVFSKFTSAFEKRADEIYGTK